MEKCSCVQSYTAGGSILCDPSKTESRYSLKNSGIILRFSVFAGINSSIQYNLKRWGLRFLFVDEHLEHHPEHKPSVLCGELEVAA